MTEAQRLIFHENYDYMWNKLSCTPYEADKQRKESTEAGSDTLLNHPEYLPCYTHLFKYKKEDTVPPLSFVNKIVRFYNENLEPPTSTFQFLNERLSDSDTIRYRRTTLVDLRFTGIYYGYYYNSSSNDPSIIRGAVLHIYSEGRTLKANMITGFSSDSQLFGKELYELIQAAPLSLEQLKEYKEPLSLVEQRCYLYEGDVELTGRSLTIYLSGKENDRRKMMVTFNIDSFPSNKDRMYRGGLGFVLTTNDGPFDTQFYLMGFVSAKLPKISLEDSRVIQALKIKKKRNEHVALTSTLDNGWFNLILREEG